MTTAPPPKNERHRELHNVLWNIDPSSYVTTNYNPDERASNSDDRVTINLTRAGASRLTEILIEILKETT
jgi:hypothetical protein